MIRLALAAVLVLAAPLAHAMSDIGGSGGGGSGVSGTGTSTYCAYWTGASSLAADAGCIYDSATNTLTLVGGGYVSSGGTTDFTCASAEDCLIAGGASTGSVVLKSLDDATDIQDSAGNVEGQIITASASTAMLIRQGSATTTGAVRLSSAATLIGSQADASATTLVGGIAESLAVGSGGTQALACYGGGFCGAVQQQTATCTDGGGASALTLTPSSSTIYLTNADADGCVVTIAETNGTLDTWVTIIVVANAGGTITFPDVANVFDGPTLCTTTGLGLNDSLVMHYADMADDMFVATSCTDN